MQRNTQAIREECAELAKKCAALEKGSALPEAEARHSRELEDLRTQHHARHSVLQDRHDSYKTAYEDLADEYDQLCKDTNTEKKDLTKRAKILELTVRDQGSAIDVKKESIKDQGSAIKDQSSAIAVKKEMINTLAGKQADLRKAVKQKDEEIEDKIQEIEGKKEEIEAVQETSQYVQLTLDVWHSVADTMVKRLEDWPRYVKAHVEFLKAQKDKKLNTGVLQDLVGNLVDQVDKSETFLEEWVHHKNDYTQRKKFVALYK